LDDGTQERSSRQKRKNGRKKRGTPEGNKKKRRGPSLPNLGGNGPSKMLLENTMASGAGTIQTAQG